MYSVYLGLLTESATPALCGRVFELGSTYFEGWAAAQRGDVEPTEMAIIVEEVHPTRLNY